MQVLYSVQILHSGSLFSSLSVISQTVHHSILPGALVKKEKDRILDFTVKNYDPKICIFKNFGPSWGRLNTTISLQASIQLPLQGEKDMVITLFPGDPLLGCADTV